MDDYDASTYGERIAEVYDERHGYLDDGGVELLAELARGGRALELGIGTGRVALPLSLRRFCSCCKTVFRRAAQSQGIRFI